MQKSYTSAYLSTCIAGFFFNLEKVHILRLSNFDQRSLYPPFYLFIYLFIYLISNENLQLFYKLMC
jgi:hypothetical protein